MGRRIERAEKELRNIIASYLLTSFKGSVSCLFSVSRVQVSSDLRHAKVFISFMDKQTEQKKNLESIQDQAFEIQSHIAKTLPMKFCPKLKFIYDFGADHSQKIEKILLELKSTDLKKIEHE